MAPNEQLTDSDVQARTWWQRLMAFFRSNTTLTAATPALPPDELKPIDRLWRVKLRYKGGNWIKYLIRKPTPKEAREEALAHFMTQLQVETDLENNPNSKKPILK